jgi:hypothetical protein
MAGADAQSRGTAKAEASDPEGDRYHRKLQRILRSSGTGPQHLSGGVGPTEKRMSEQMKEATLSPRLVNPGSVPEDESPLFQCTECDMIVRESDPYCPFCGAIFADGALGEGELDETTEKPVFERPSRREEMIRPEKFDLFSLLRTRSRSKELLYQEALKGFAGSARLLEEVEHLISDVGSLGTDTSKARRLVGNAWEAARDGNWHLVSSLARQTEELMSPSIPDLVRSEIARARKYLMEAKAVGIDISVYILQIKSAMQSLRADDPDDALRITKELMDRLREDAIRWD